MKQHFNDFIFIKTLTDNFAFEPDKISLNLWFSYVIVK